MTTVSYDGQSLIIGSRRIWLTSGSIHYPRVPHQLWRSRIRAAKQAGLNCIDTFVFWNVHEPKPGQFDFEGDHDLRRFVETIGEEGMYCILRPGPYVGADWDFGGLPPWLTRVEGMRLRQTNGPFQEACARYLGAVLDQVKDLQVTSSAHPTGVPDNGGFLAGNGDGPIVMMQVENHWYCDPPKGGETYLTELTRYLREHGCTVPICDSNHLWSRTERVISAWSGTDHLPSDLRQLRVVQPYSPAFVIDCPPGQVDQWGQTRHQDVDPVAYQFKLASILAVGAQYNISPFHGGTNYGFFSGRNPQSDFRFTTTSYDRGAPLPESGVPGPLYTTTKRVSVFASQFDQLFAYLEPQRQHACIGIDDDQVPGLSVVHQSGSHGDVVFLFKSAKDKTTQTKILLPNGLTLPIPIGDDRVTWFVINAALGGVATLNYTNLRPWAFVGKRLLVLFGPAGADGLVCINEAPLQVSVPQGRQPVALEEHEQLTIAVLNQDQVDSAFISPSGLVLGAVGLDDRDQPIPVKGRARASIVHHNGKVKSVKAKSPPRSSPPRLSSWKQACVGALLDGTSEQYQSIDGPASLEELGCDYGYGWYRLTFKSSVTAEAFAPQSADRIHLYRKGKLDLLFGNGPSAQQGPTQLRFEGHMVVLADNLGRFSDGWALGEQKGLYGHFHAVESVDLNTAKKADEKPPDLFTLRHFFPRSRKSEQTQSQTFTWKIKASGKNPIVVEVDRLPSRAMLLVNDEPIGAYDPRQSGGIARWVLTVGQELKTTQNQIKLAILGPSEDHSEHDKALRIARLSKYLRIYRVKRLLSAKADWAFAPWTPPDGDDFHPLSKADPPQPHWYRCSFESPRNDLPLWFELERMTKGQILINGHNLGRYFIATHMGEAVGPQKRYFIPQPWLHTDQPNELLIFDEHGASPKKCRLVHASDAF